jgi:hypothetical protein
MNDGTTAEPGTEPRVDCSVCGHALTLEEQSACHPACPMASGCAMVRCPACGAEFPRPGPVTRWLERLLRPR